MNLDNYLRMLSSMTVKKTRGRLSPHKAIMLLAVIDMIEFELTDGNCFYLDDETESSYQYNWNHYVPEDIFLFKPNPWTPYWHLQQEPFWHFVAKKGMENCLDTLVPKGQTASVGKMREVIEYACLDDEFYSLLKEDVYRTKVRELLLNTYINAASQTVINDEANSDDSSIINQEELFRKNLDWSMFNSGTTIPTPYHDAILSVCDEPLHRGSSKHVNIVFEGNEYEAVLRSVDIKGRKGNCLQFNWTKNSPLAKILRETYSDVYDRLFLQRNHKSENLQVLPEKIIKSVAFCRSSVANTYLLLPIR